MIEEWRDIPGWDGYQASSLGRIRSLDHTRSQLMRDGSMQEVSYPGRVRKLFRCPVTRYMRVGLSKPGMAKGRRTMGVHVLVCLAFHGEMPPKHDAAHWNGQRWDNRPNNLRWATRKENAADRTRHGTENIGDRNGMSRINRDRRAQLEGVA